jgi:hypothetical protein
MFLSALRIAQNFNPEKQTLTPLEIIHLPTIACTSNVQRHVQYPNGFRLEASFFSALWRKRCDRTESPPSIIP